MRYMLAALLLAAAGVTENPLEGISAPLARAV